MRKGIKGLTHMPQNVGCVSTKNLLFFYGLIYLILILTKIKLMQSKLFELGQINLLFEVLIIHLVNLGHSRSDGGAFT